jgi:signal peptidase I
MLRQTIKRSLAILALLVISVGAAGLVYIQASGSKLMSVQSGSMVPSFSRGDLVAVKKVPVAELKLGDVITFANPKNTKQTITHRIVKHEKGLLQTKGDANPSEDQPISSSYIVGRVDHVVPFLGYGIDLVKQPIGLILIIYVPALGIIIEELRKLAKYFKQQQPYMSLKLRERLEAQKRHLPWATAAKLTFAVIAASMLVIVPANAELQDTVSLSPNTLVVASTVPPEPTEPADIVFRRVTLNCSVNNTSQEAVEPSFMLFNTTRENLDLTGWHIDDNTGPIHTFAPGTVLKRQNVLDFDVIIPTTDPGGLQFAGDRLVLMDATNNPVDGLSWGSDTSQLNPSLPAMTDPTVLNRYSPTTDSNTAADWLFNPRRCNE